MKRNLQQPQPVGGETVQQSTDQNIQQTAQVTDDLTADQSQVVADPLNGSTMNTSTDRVISLLELRV